MTSSLRKLIDLAIYSNLIEPEPFLKDLPNKIQALAYFLNIESDIEKVKQIKDISEEDYYNMIGECFYEYHYERYYVLTNSEADYVFDVEFKYYLEEVIYPYIPKYLHNYFDEYQYKKDLLLDGRGFIIAKYDGKENDVFINNRVFFIYRYD
jgi:hypothetical protein